jgi:hypothetical protein
MSRRSSTSESIQNALRIIRESAETVMLVNSRNIGRLSAQDQQELSKAVSRILRYSRALDDARNG